MTKQCLVCGKDFITYPSKILLGRGKYCSSNCSLLVTNKIFSQNGESTRFKKGQTPTNKKGFTITRARKGGRQYILTHCPTHPACTKRGYVREHRLVMEKCLGRYLSNNEVVHHIDGNTLNNDLSNLKLMTTEEHNAIKDGPRN